MRTRPSCWLGTPKGHPMSAHQMARGLAVVILLLAATACPAFVAPSRRHATVLLKDGTIYEQRPFTLRRSLQILVVEHDHAGTSISFSDIEAIVDSTGANIAPVLLRMHYHPAGLEKVGREDFVLARQIVLASGEEIKKTRFVMNPNRQEMLILDGARPRAIRWDRVQRIVDSAGHDVTVTARSGDAVAATVDSVLVRESFAPAAANAPPVVDAGGSIRSALPWRFALELKGGFDAPSGGYYTGTRGGAGYGGVLHIAINDETALRFDVSRVGMEFANSVHLVSFDPNFIFVSQSYDVDPWRVELGVEYHAPLDKWQPNSGFWFVQSSFGAIRHRLRGEAVVQTGTQLVTVVATDTEAGFVTSLGAGLIRAVQRHVGLTVSVDLDLLLKDPLGFVPGVRAGFALLQ